MLFITWPPARISPDMTLFCFVYDVCHLRMLVSMMFLEVSPAHSYLLHPREIIFSLLGTSGGERSVSPWLWGYCCLRCEREVPTAVKIVATSFKDSPIKSVL